MAEKLVDQLDSFPTYSKKHDHVMSLVEARNARDILARAGKLAAEVSDSARRLEDEYVYMKSLELSLVANSKWYEYRSREPHTLVEFGISGHIDVELGIAPYRRGFSGILSVTASTKDAFGRALRERTYDAPEERAFLGAALYAVNCRALSDVYGGTTNLYQAKNRAIDPLELTTVRLHDYNPNDAGFQEFISIETERLSRRAIDASRDAGRDVRDLTEEDIYPGMQSSTLPAYSRITAHKVLQLHGIFQEESI